MFFAALARELKLVARSPSQVLNPLVFLVLAVFLFALALEGKQEQLAPYAAAVLWVLVLLTMLLSLDAIFRRDLEEGTLEQLLIVPTRAMPAVAAKLVVAWLASGFLVALLSPLLGLWLGVPQPVLVWLTATMVLGTPTVTLLGAIGAALTVGVSRGGALLGLLVLPLFVPLLIFATTIVNGVMEGQAFTAQVYWLAALSVAAITLAPFAVLQALKISVEI